MLCVNISNISYQTFIFFWARMNLLYSFRLATARSCTVRKKDFSGHLKYFKKILEKFYFDPNPVK